MVRLIENYLHNDRPRCHTFGKYVAEHAFRRRIIIINNNNIYARVGHPVYIMINAHADARAQSKKSKLNPFGLASV